MIAVNLKGKVHSQVQVSTETVCRQTCGPILYILENQPPSPHQGPHSGVPLRGPTQGPSEWAPPQAELECVTDCSSSYHWWNWSPALCRLLCLWYVLARWWRWSPSDTGTLLEEMGPELHKPDMCGLNPGAFSCWVVGVNVNTAESKRHRVFLAFSSLHKQSPDTSMRIISSWFDHWYFCVTSLIIWSTGKSLFSVWWSQSSICSLNTKPEAHPKLVTVFANGDYSTIAFMGSSYFSELEA